MHDPFTILAIAMGGDTEDAVDLSKGARLIPGEVTDMRRRGEYINYIPAHSDQPDMWVDINGNVVAKDDMTKKDTPNDHTSQMAS